MLVGRHEDKDAVLLWLLREVVAPGAPTLVFAATRHHVEYLHTLLGLDGIQTACVYGQMDQVPRTGCRLGRVMRAESVSLSGTCNTQH